VDTNAVLYALSTLAQTCAALAAFVGAVGVYRLQLLRDRHRDTENEMRGLSALTGLGIDQRVVPLRKILDHVEGVRKKRTGQLEEEELLRAFDAWQAVSPLSRQSRFWLVIFEAWNLFWIGVSLVGFNYIQLLVSSPCTSLGLWVAAVGTVAVTGYCVYAWTRG